MNPFIKHSDIQVVHDLTHMAVHLSQELDNNLDVYFDLEQKDWSEELQQIHRIIGDHLL